MHFIILSEAFALEVGLFPWRSWSRWNASCTACWLNRFIGASWICLIVDVIHTLLIKKEHFIDNHWPLCHGFCILSRPCETHVQFLTTQWWTPPHNLLTVHHLFNATYDVFSLALTQHNLCHYTWHVQFFICFTTSHCVKLWIIHRNRATIERHVCTLLIVRSDKVVRRLGLSRLTTAQSLIGSTIWEFSVSSGLRMGIDGSVLSIVTVYIKSMVDGCRSKRVKVVSGLPKGTAVLPQTAHVNI